jgi:hypothetical protein
VIHATAHSDAGEDAVRAQCEAAWNLTIRPMPHLSVIDWYATEGQTVRAWLEVKVRTCTSDAYADTYLPARKYLALVFAGLAFGTPGIFVAGFPDRVLWIPVLDVDPARHEIVRSASDDAPRSLEPVVLVPVAEMRPL